MSKSRMHSHHGIKEPVKGKYPNQTLKLLIQRASCRSFSNKKVSSRVMKLILEAGMHAPSGGNLQPFSIIKIENEKTKHKLAELNENQVWISNAPVNLLFCIDYYRLQRWAELEMAPFTATSSFRHFWIAFQDTIICAQNICTAADSLGLGSVYIGTVMDCFREIRDMFELPKGVFPVVLLCLGYPKIKPAPRKKLKPEIVVHNEKYQQMDKQNLIEAFNNKYPDLKIEITEERLKRIFEVSKRVHGDKFARKCIENIKKNGYINPVQRYFGLHYCADEMPLGNDTYLEIMEESGFKWFKKFQFYKGK